VTHAPRRITNLSVGGYNKAMRIVHVVSRSQRRGAERAAVDLAEELDALGHENHLISLVEGMDGTEDATLPALVHSPSLGWGARALSVWRLGRYLARHQPEVVLAHGGSAAQVSIATPTRNRPPVVWQQILPFPDKIARQPRRALWKAVTRGIDGSIALTDDAAAAVRDLGFAGPVWVIPNFRRPHRFEAVDRVAAARALRAEAGVPETTRVIAFVGYLVPQKRPERALDVLEGVRRAGVDAHLVIAGDGPLRPVLERAIAERDLAASVSLLGHRDDVENVFGGADVAIMTSEVEGIPGVAIEAAMAGCPFVTFPVGGVGEVVDDGATGIVLDRPDTALMANRTAELLRDERRRRAMADEARRRSSRFTAHDRVTAYNDALAACAAAKGGNELR
jgi:glycosyltransferase involved in cell wall biosynthesis